MSPEQLRERPLDARSDLYSLGLVAFELLCGREVLAGNTLGEQLGRLLSEQLNVPGVNHSPIMRIVAKMTQRDPSSRYPSASAVISVLDEIEGPSVTGAAPFDDTLQAPSRASTEDDRRSKAIWWVILVVIVVVAMAIAWWIRNAAPATQPRVVSREGLVKGRSSTSPAVRETGHHTPISDAGLLDLGLVSGCGQDPPVRGMIDAHVRLPESYDSTQPHPVVFTFRPLLIDAKTFIDGSGLSKLSAQDGFITVAPHAANFGEWRSLMTADDVEKVFDSVRQNLCVDESRVYVVGQADGANFGWDLACEDWVRGVVFSGHLPSVERTVCPVAKPVLLLLPRHSSYVPFDGGRICANTVKKSAADTEEIWIRMNGCAPNPKRREFPGGECLSWDCSSPFQSCHLEGGRDWPGVPAPALICDEPAAASFPADDVVREFFRSLDRPEVD